MLCAVIAAGCGSDETGSADLPGALGYAPPDAFAVVLVPTDFEGDQLRRLEHLLEPALRESGAGSLREALVETRGEIDYERDIEPLLGDTLVVAASGNVDDPDVIAALETPNAAKAAAAARKVEDVDARSDGPTLLLALNHGDEALRAAIGRKQASDGMTGKAFADAFGDGASDDALVRVLGDARTLARELEVDADVPWIRALTSAAVSLRLEGDRIDLQARLRTDPEGLEEDDLPLATGDDAPEAGDVDGAIAAANRDQSRTTVFLASLARAAYPDSTFVREVDALERDLGISFEEEVLRQFNGPSASVATPDGAFAAVSDVADPDRMRALLPKLAPRLPAILRGLQGLGNTGLVALLLFAPDAPLVPGALPLLQDGIGVRRLPGGDLYQLTGLDEDDAGPSFAVPSVVFGLIGERFVVATDERRARSVSQMEVSDVEGANGAAVARADIGSWSRAVLERNLGLPTVPLGELTGAVQASTEGVEGRLRIAVPGGLD